MNKWKKVKLKDYIEQIRGVSYKPEDATDVPTEGYCPILRANNIKDNVLIFDDFVYVKENKIKKEQMIQKGDVIVCASSGSKELVGKAAQAKKDLQMSFGAFCKGVRAKNILLEYLGNYFKSPIYRKTISRLSAGANINNIKSEHLDNLEIPLPAMEEQKKIAARLDAVSDLLAKQKQLLSEQDNLIQSTFYDMFGDPLKNNKGWKIEKLGNLFSVSSGGTPDTKNKEYWENGDISWIGSNLCQNVILTKNDGKFITQKGLENSSAKIISAGSVLIALVGATIGKTALLTFETTTNQNIAAIDVIKNENFSSYFIFYLIQALYQEFLNIGSGKFKMANLTFVRNLKIPIPPLELQEKFAAIVEQIESEKSKIKSAIAETQTLFNALMSEYFEE